MVLPRKKAIRPLLGGSNRDPAGLGCQSGSCAGEGKAGGWISDGKERPEGGMAAAFPWCVPVLGSLCEGYRTAEENILGECLLPAVLQGSGIHKCL